MASSKRRFKQVFKAGKRDERRRGSCRQAGNMKAMDGVKEEQRPHALVEVVAAAAEAVERLAFGEQLVEREALAQGIERAGRAVRRCAGDDRR